jgi:hypothetical protein
MAVVGAALGATAMFVLDPDKGRRRRALVRDRTRRSVKRIAHLLELSARDLSHRTHGFRAVARRLFARNGATDDLVLIERVRAKMGRVVSHPHAIQIGAREGRVMLSGPILPAEATPLLEAVRSVPGVSGVEDHLVVFDRPESIPSLQGGVRRGGIRGVSRPRKSMAMLRIATIFAGALAITAFTRKSYRVGPLGKH